MTRKVSAEPPASGLRGRAWRWSAANSDSRLVRALRHVVHSATPYVHAENHDIATNGEAYLLDRLGSDATTILDVGACFGDWTIKAVEHCPSATVYCFEIASSTRQQLEAKLSRVPRVRVMPYGLADQAGTLRVKYYQAQPAWSSIYDYPHDGQALWIDEAVSTGDAALAQLGLPSVDLLKIDAEGAEMAILRGFAEALERRAIRVIQFEYGFAAVFSHGLLADFYMLLEPLGYTIGRLGSGGVEFLPYRLRDETFFGPNFVAVRSEETTLVRKIGRGKGP
jgi:FkbM family methyltransferase